MSEYIVNLDGELGMALAVACAGAGFAREEIVRCRDCKYLVSDDSVWVCDGFGANIGFNNGTPPDGFCAWGERHKP